MLMPSPGFSTTEAEKPPRLADATFRPSSSSKNTLLLSSTPSLVTISASMLFLSLGGDFLGAVRSYSHTMGGVEC